MPRRNRTEAGEPARRGYRDLATPKLLAWALASLTGKLPIAMATLGMVFLVRTAPGGYTLGATLAGTYVVGEVLSAPVLGTRLRPERIQTQLAVALAVGGLAFAGLSIGRDAGPVVLLPLAFVAGAAPAVVPGGLRQLLTTLVPEADVPRALSAEGVLVQLIWASAPALVALLALGVAPVAPMVLAAASALCAAGLVRLIRTDKTAAEQAAPAPRSRIAVLASAWPIYITSAAAMSVVAAAELALAPLLEYRRLPVGLAGALLAGFSVASAAGAYCYGLRRWPGSVRAQGLVLLCGTATFVALSALVPSVYGIAAGLLVAGFLQAGVLISRSLSIREQLPPALHAAGFSVMYGVQGIGYTLTSMAVALLLANASPAAAVLVGVGVTAALIATGAVAEYRPHRQVKESAGLTEVST